MSGIKKVLVTGAGGFIGRALCARILAEDWQVRGTVRSESGVKRLPDGTEAISIGSIDSDTNWDDALRDIDTVVHLAARVHVMDDNCSDPLAEYRKVNVKGTKFLALAAANAEIKRFIFISSIKVNGEGKAVAYTEEDDEAPEDPYGVSKWEAEQELHKIADKTGLETVILRAPLVYGPGVKANFYNLLKIVDRGIPLPLAGINNQRSFIFVDNLVDAIIHCIKHPKVARHIFLISDGENVSTSELIRKIASALEKSARLFSVPPFLIRLAGMLLGKSAAIDRLFGSLTIDNTKIIKKLEWKPPYTMEYGLKKAAKWYQRVGKQISWSDSRMKRIFDIVLATIFFMVLLLFLLVIALSVKLTSKGPILYWSDRVGKNNRVFKMPKFRTMYVNTPAVATHLLTNPDKHCTHIGKFLRKSSFDELPQLYSVIKGDMSFVGPRPALFNQDDLIDLRTKKGIHNLIPGITGWAQINGRDDLPIPEKVELDEYYLNNRSFIFDLKTLFMTFLSVINSQGVQH